MAEIKQVFQVTSVPGIRRDGTVLDGDNYTDGQWVRFQRGRPKKMGGYREITDSLTGPVRLSFVWSRGYINTIYSFSQAKVEMLQVDQNGVGSAVYDRTPVGFVDNVDNVWSGGLMYDDAVGSKGTIVVAVATQSLSNIDDDTPRQVYWGTTDTTTPLQALGSLQVSGGVVCIAPYLVYFGSDGLVGWSDVNQPQVLNSGDAGSDRVTGSKIVTALPVRGGNGPSALLWSLDSLISMQWVGGSAVFRFTTISSQTSILSQNSIIEYDGVYYWAGIDRFLVYAGGQVQELPNQNNLNWFYDNLNYNARQKVWAMKVPRFGEIWWFYPRGDAEECTHAVIYNVREKTWYDVELPRSCGYYSQVFRYPVMISSEANDSKQRLTATVTSGSLNEGDSIRGLSSNTSAVIYRKLSATQFIVNLVNSQEFTVGETLSNQTVSGSATLSAVEGLYSVFTHEIGTNAVFSDNELPIRSFFETADFGLPTGGAQQNQIQGVNRWTRLVRVEPDFLLSGSLTLNVIGREFAQGDDTESRDYVLQPGQTRVDMREQARQIRLRFTSDELGGHYEAGRIMLHTEPGDVRS